MTHSEGREEREWGRSVKATFVGFCMGGLLRGRGKMVRWSLMRWFAAACSHMGSCGRGSRLPRLSCARCVAVGRIRTSGLGGGA